MNDFVKFHIKNNFFIKLEQIPEINGLKITFPERKIYRHFQTDSSWKIYESDYDSLNIYKDGSKLRNLFHKPYSHRPTILLDIIYTCKKYNISTDLIVLLKDDDIQAVGFENIKLPKLIEIEESKQEKKLTELMKKFANKEDYKHILSKYNFHDEKDIFEEIIEKNGL